MSGFAASLIGEVRKGCLSCSFRGRRQADSVQQKCSPALPNLHLRPGNVPADKQSDQTSPILCQAVGTAACMWNTASFAEKREGELQGSSVISLILAGQKFHILLYITFSFSFSIYLSALVSAITREPAELQQRSKQHQAGFIIMAA